MLDFLSPSRRRTVALASIAALVLGATGCGKEPVEKITPSAAAPSASDAGGSDSGASANGVPSAAAGDGAYVVAPPLMSREEALETYERVKTPVETTHMPAENKDLPVPSRSDYPATTENSEQGAAETLALYTETIYYAFATGDARPALEVVDVQQCINCAVYLKAALDGAQKGSYGMSPELTYDTFYYEEADDGDIIVELPYQHGEIWESNMGERVKTSGPRSGTVLGKLRWTGSGWVLVEFAETLDE